MSRELIHKKNIVMEIIQKVFIFLMKAIRRPKC
ncbi:MAG: hypothetical protein H6Q57_2015 [Geobacteraceae bacterium]|nr:hypothetical protein [Geobacteraceae bacterium]